MDNKTLSSVISREIQKDLFAYQAYEDFYGINKLILNEDKDFAIANLKWLSETISERMPVVVGKDLELGRKLMGLHRKVLHAAAPYDFDSYLLYLEFNRDPEKKFYPPRRNVLKVLVDDLQDLEDGKLDFLSISLPPRVGKSTLCIFFMTWIMGKHPNDASVMSGHSDKLTDGFYRELLSIITDHTEYLWQEVFPGVRLADTSAKNETIDLDRKKRFPTITCRSISGTLTGAVEVGTNGVLYVDDAIEDLEESLNPMRLQAKYDAYLNQLKDRKKMGARELMVATRWNVMDIQGRLEEQYADNPRYRFRVIPAIDEDGHSNFQYQFGLGFDDAYYADMKASIDDATWNAKYMGRPYVRDGLLFPEDELLTYNGVLPDGEPLKLAVCDVAWGGGDSLSMIFAYVFGDSVYIHDVVFNRGDKEVTYPVVIGRIVQHMPNKIRFESNNGGTAYSEHVDEALRKQGIHINIFAKPAPNNQSKLGRIIQFAPDIKRFYFRDAKHRSKEYRAFMREMTTFVQTGKNPHDDSCDSAAMLADELYHNTYAAVKVIKRVF